MECYCIVCHFIQPDTAYSGSQPAEISIAELFTQTYGFEYFRSPIRADGTDTHLTHDLEQSLADGFDIFLFGCGIIQLDFFLRHQLVDYGECHVRVQGTGAKSQ